MRAPYFRTPTIAPDGAQVAFVYAGDIWLVSIEGGDAQRLTANPAGHSSRWSPDRAEIAFSASRTGQGDTYVLPLAGGELRRVTYHDTASVVEDWSTDGQQIFFSSARAAGQRNLSCRSRGWHAHSVDQPALRDNQQSGCRAGW